MSDLRSALVDFALQYGISPEDAIALSPLFDRASQEVGLTPLQLARATKTNKELGEYLALMAETVATKFYEDEAASSGGM